MTKQRRPTGSKITTRPAKGENKSPRIASDYLHQQLDYATPPLPSDKVTKIRHLHSIGLSLGQIAPGFGIPWQAVAAIVSKKPTKWVE